MENKVICFVVLIVIQFVNIQITKAEDESLPQWVTDGTPGFTTSGNVVSSAKEGYYTSPANALWKETAEGVKSGSHYWEITIIEGDEYFIGMSDLEKFQTGWALDGLFYGGNLADGSSLLVGNFGPWPKAGDVIGMLINFEDGKMKIYFYINGRPLGLAFDLEESVLNGAFPTVQFHGAGSISIEKINEVPVTTEREAEKFGPYEGNWELVSLKKDGEDEEIRTSVTLNINLNNDDDYPFYTNLVEGAGGRGASQTYSVRAAVINSIWAAWVFNEENGSWSAYPGASTLIGGSPDAMQFEFKISNLISTVTDVQPKDNELQVTSKSGNTITESVWKRFTPSVGVVTKNPFDRT